MDVAAKNPKDPGKQLSGSLRDTLNSFFTRDRASSSDAAVLTAYKELSDGEDIGSRVEDASCVRGNRDDAEQRSDATVKDSCGTAEATGDTDLVQVTRVETHSDTENEDEDRVKNCAASPESSVPEGEPKQVDHVDEEEQNVPVFRTHMFRDKSQIEAILFSSRFGKRGRSKSALDSVKSEKSIESLPEKENTKPDGSEQSSEEYVGIDCSEPVPSVISGHPKPEGPDLNGDVAPSNKEAEHEDKRFVEQSGECPSTQTSSSVSSSSDTAEEAKSPTRTEEQPSLTEESKPDTPLSVQPLKTKTPKTTIGSPVSSAASKLPTGTTLSSPPSFQMPALFSGLRVLKKGAVGEDREVVSEIKQREKDADLALLSLKKTVNKARLFPERMTASSLGKKPSEPKSSRTIGSLNQLDEVKKSSSEQKVDCVNGNGEKVAEEKSPSTGSPTLAPEKKKTTDLAYETFRNIFGPKTVKRETEELDLDAVKRKIKSDKESLRSIFERTSKSPGKESPSPLETSVRRHTPKTPDAAASCLPHLIVRVRALSFVFHSDRGHVPRRQ